MPLYYLIQHDTRTGEIEELDVFTSLEDARYYLDGIKYASTDLDTGYCPYKWDIQMQDEEDKSIIKIYFDE